MVTATVTGMDMDTVTDRDMDTDMGGVIKLLINKKLYGKFHP